MKKRTIIAGAIAVMALAGPTGAAAAEERCESPRDHKVFRVEIAPLARTVERGEAAQVRATVYRSVKGRNLAPAEGANVVVSLSAGRFVRAAGAITDDHGLATVRIPLGRRFPTGWADASAYAAREPADLPCDPYREAGGTRVERFLRVL